MARGFIIILLIGYTVYRFFRFFFKGSSSSDRTSFGRNSAKGDAKVRTDRNPKSVEDKSFQGGEYIDYEEVD